MAIGMNALRLRGVQSPVKAAREALQAKRDELTTCYYELRNDERDDWNEYHRLHAECEILEYELWCAEYEDNLRRIRG